MYCDFNPGLFKDFTSMKTKIKPEIADDWVIVPSAYNTNSGFSLKSKKLNQQVADINLYRFLQFSGEYNLVIDSLKLQGNFIIGNDRSVYTKEMYNEWKTKFNTRTEVIIPKKDYIPGHKYKTPCGEEVVYLGTKYVSKMKEYPKTTKITKKHFIKAAYGIITTLEQKFTKDLGFVLNKEQIEEIFKEYIDFYQVDIIVIFEDDKPKSDEIELVETTRKYSKYFRANDGVFVYSRFRLQTNAPIMQVAWEDYRVINSETFELEGTWSGNTEDVTFLGFATKKG